MAVRLCQKQPVFRKWIVRAVSVWLIPIQKRSTNLNIIWYITRDEMICDLCMVNASWVSLTMTLKEAEWGWCDNCTLSLFGVGRVELAGTHPHFCQLRTQHWSLVGCTVSTIYLFTVSTKYWLDPFLFSVSRHKRDYVDIEWEEQNASLVPSVAAGSIFHCP